MNRVAVGGVVYHVINRSNGRVPIFHNDEDYRHFESLLLEGVELIGMRILAYCIVPNHWHLALHPKKDRDMSEFMRWVTTTHV
jgi:putative transposase